MTTFANVPVMPGSVTAIESNLAMITPPADKPNTWYLVPEALESQVQVGWYYDGNTFSAPQEPVDVPSQVSSPVITPLEDLEDSLALLHKKVDLLIKHSTLAHEASAIYKKVVDDIQMDVSSVPLLKRTLNGIKEVLAKL